METTTVPTYWANIYLGLKEGYDGPVSDVEVVKMFCEDYCKEFERCVTITPTHFVYINGSEPGVIIGLINYPRHPKTSEEIHRLALVLAGALANKFNQMRVTVVFPDETIMLDRSATWQPRKAKQ